MKGAALQLRPAFALMGQNDEVTFQHLRLPSWLFGEPRYRALGAEARVAYALLLNRFQLSQRNGWVNPDGEVFVVYTRAAMARDLQVSEKRASACFRALAGAGLIYEKRMGQGRPNQIYLAVLPGSQAPSGQEEGPPAGEPTAQAAPRPAKEGRAGGTEARPAQNRRNGSSRTAETAAKKERERKRTRGGHSVLDGGAV